MRPVANLSKAVSAALIPLCIWGIVSTLLLHLIAIRSIFIRGGESRLRIAVLAFAAGVILLQRLIRTQGEAYARAYVLAIGAAMTLFALHNAYAYRLPAPPLLVFVINLILFGTLWWVVHRITAACSADSPEALAAASESGSLRGLKFRLPARVRINDPSTIELLEQSEAADERWAEKLPFSHPGRVLLYFSLFAIPAFGLGAYLFPENDPHRARLGVLLFVYLWCVLALLFLSSLNLLANYFRERGVTLPDSVGFTWLAIGFTLVTSTLALAFFLPQPRSVTNTYVRDRIEASWEGWSRSKGLSETAPEGAPRAGRAEGHGGSADASASTLSRGSGGGKTGEGGAGERNRGGEGKDRFETAREADSRATAEALRKPPEGRTSQSNASGAVNALDRFFEKVLSGALLVGVVSAAFVVIVLMLVMLRGVAGSFAEFRFRRNRIRPESKTARKKKEGKAPTPAFRRFTDPFAGGSGLDAGDELVRYLWRATLAWCADFGSPCKPGQTPAEFLGESPAALKGFEEQAGFLARMINFSEFSGQAVPDSARPQLQEYWAALQRHVRANA